MVLIIMQFTEDMGMGIIPNMYLLICMMGRKILGCMKIIAINLQKYDHPIPNYNSSAG